jgi:PAS domain S-box-containing protein
MGDMRGASAAGGGDPLGDLRYVAQQTARSIQAMQRRTQRQLLDAKRALEVQTRELRSSLSLVHATLESSPNGILVADPTGRVVAWNERYRELWRFPQGLLESGDGNALTAHAAQLVKNGERFARRVRELLDRPQVVASDIVELNDGRIFERYVSPQYIDARCVGTVINWNDITERKRAEQALLESRARLQALFDNALNAVVMLTDEGRYVEANPAACCLLAWSREELLSKTVHQVVADARPSAAQPQAMVEVWERFLRDGRAHGLFELQRRDGEVRTIEYEAAAHVLPGLHLAVLSDVTERIGAEHLRVAKEVAEAANRAKSNFLSRMSHELRTPLNAITGFAELLLLDAEPALRAEQRQRVEHIREAGVHLLALINDVLDVSRIETGSMRLLLENIDVTQVVQAAVLSMRTQADNCGVTMAVDVQVTTPCLVLGDTTRLQQVMLNLLSNAIKYNRAGGSVRVQLQCAGPYVHVAVIDDGIGMDAAQLRRLYQPFDRLGRENSAVEGTGIGLVITRNLVEMMGGSLSVHSQPGVGSRFTVELSAAAADCAGNPRGAPADSPQTRADVRGCVLYIDDDEVNRMLMTAFFDLRPRVRLELAADGQAGIAAARLHRPDLILIDMRLPDMDGTDVLHAIRADARVDARAKARSEARTHPRSNAHDDPSSDASAVDAAAATPCLAVSANAMPEDIAAAQAQGFDGYLTKPLSLGVLLAEVDARLGTG